MLGWEILFLYHAASQLQTWLEQRNKENLWKFYSSPELTNQPYSKALYTNRGNWIRGEKIGVGVMQVWLMVGGCYKLPKSKFQILTTTTVLYGQK